MNALRLAPLGSTAAASDGRWLQPLHHWPAALMQALANEYAVVRVVVAQVRGSAPREPGTCMLVGPIWTRGTIGGGQLESAAIDAARSLLVDLRSAPGRLWKLVLGTELAQCCGGVVELWIERYTRTDLPFLQTAMGSMQQGGRLLVSTLAGSGIERRIVHDASSAAYPMPMTRAGADARLTRLENGQTSLCERLDGAAPSLWLFGAGHVGQALIRVLEHLPLSITWIDSRADLLPGDVTESVTVRHTADPLAIVPSAAPATSFIVMTHSHALDYALCRAILERSDFKWAGVIGSKSKAARFRARLAREGVAAERIERLTCPIGIEGVDSKAPPAIAISVAAQVLQTLTARRGIASPSGLRRSLCAADSETCGSCASCGTLRRDP